MLSDDAALATAAKRLMPGSESEAEPATSGGGDSMLAQWRTICLGRAEDTAGRVALMDTTTLLTAQKLVGNDDSRLATPLSVLDLVTFLNTACHYEKICFLENPYIRLDDLEAAFGPDLFIELPANSAADPDSDYGALGDMREPLRGIYKHQTLLLAERSSRGSSRYSGTTRHVGRLVVHDAAALVRS